MLTTRIVGMSFVIAVLLLGACAPRSTQAPTLTPIATPTPTLALTPTPTPTPTPKPTLTPREVELKYDDGKPDGKGFAIGGSGAGHLVQFSPPATPFTVTKVRIFGNAYGTGYEKRTFDVQIWDRGFKEIHSVSYAHTKFSLSPGWVEIDVPKVIVNDYFYVHVVTNTPRGEGGIQIFGDSSVKNEHSEVTQNWQIADWYITSAAKEQVNWMIRVIGIAALP